MKIKSIILTMFLVGVISAGQALAGDWGTNASISGFRNGIPEGQRGVDVQESLPDPGYSAGPYSYNDVVPEGQRGTAEQQSNHLYARRVQEGPVSRLALGMEGTPEQDPNMVYPNRATQGTDRNSLAYKVGKLLRMVD